MFSCGKCRAAHAERRGPPITKLRGRGAGGGFAAEEQAVLLAAIFGEVAIIEADGEDPFT